MINFISEILFITWASLVAQVVKNPHAMQEIQVQSLGAPELGPFGSETTVALGLGMESATLSLKLSDVKKVTLVSGPRFPTGHRVSRLGTGAGSRHLVGEGSEVTVTF